MSLFSYSQERFFGVMPLKNGNIVYSGIFKIDKTKQSELFLRAKRWFVLTFGDIKGASITNEIEGSMLIGKGGVSAYSRDMFGSTNTSIWFTIVFNLADNQCSYEILKFLELSPTHSAFYPLENFTSISSRKSKEKNEKEFISAIDIKIKSLIQSFKDALDPNSSVEISSLLQNFNAFQQNKDNASALKTIKDAYTKYPEDMRILLPLIDYYIANIRTNEVLEYINKAIAIENDNPLLYIKKGKAFLNLDMDPEALNEFKNAIQVKPNNLLVYFHIGMAYRDRAIQKVVEKKSPNEDLAQTLYYWEEGLKIDKSDKNMKTNISQLKGDIKKYK